MLLRAISELLQYLRTWWNVKKSIRVSNMIVDEILRGRKTEEERNAKKNDS